MKFAICNELFEGWTFERVCRYVKIVDLVKGRNGQYGSAAEVV